jgi:uncharacterized protein DUF4197
MPPQPRRRRGEGGRLLACALASAALGCASSLAGGEISDATIAAGLKDALEVGTRSAVAIASRKGGYSDDPRLRIGLPDALDKLAKGLRVLGFSDQLEELELAMNRAAEEAAAQAAPVFAEAIARMTITDARAILEEGDSAATEYFERATRSELESRFAPIIGEKMGRVGVVQRYDQLLSRYRSLPFTQSPSLDIRRYVTDRALDGLFVLLAEQERLIRTDPAARTTALLKQVFGR